MSRIGRQPVAIPAGVEVRVADGNVVTVKGPKGTLTRTFDDQMNIKVEENEVIVSVIAIGYPATEPANVKRKTADDILKVF